MGLVRTRHKGVESALQPPPLPDALSPVARINLVPGQRVSGTFDAGAIAFSKPGVWGVVFTATDGVTQVEYTSKSMTMNARVGYWEYWVPIDMSVFSDGPVTIDSKVIGNDGGETVLDQIEVMNNTSGSLPVVKAWVTAGGIYTGALTGNETTDEANPYGSISDATNAIRNYRQSQGFGTDADGGIVYLGVGTFPYDRAGRTLIQTTQEWLTITTATGVTQAEAIVRNGNGNIMRCKFDGVSVIGTVGESYLITNYIAGAVIWFHNSVLVGNTDMTSGNARYNKIFNSNISESYLTNNDVSAFNFVVDGLEGGTKLTRGGTIYGIGEDIFRNMDNVSNVDIDHGGPEDPASHADVWQYFVNNRAWENLILFGLRCKNIASQGFDVDVTSGTGWPCNGVAIVNCLFHKVNNGILPDSYFMLWKRPASHFLLWNNTFEVATGVVNLDYVNFTMSRYWDIGGEYSDIDIRGNSFFTLTSASITGTGNPITYRNIVVEENNYRETYGDDSPLRVGETNKTVGNPNLNVDHKPTAGSILNNRLTPLLVPVDAGGVVRSDPADLGAYEQV